MPAIVAVGGRRALRLGEDVEGGDQPHLRGRGREGNGRLVSPVISCALRGEERRLARVAMPADGDRGARQIQADRHIFPGARGERQRVRGDSTSGGNRSRADCQRGGPARSPAAHGRTRPSPSVARSFARSRSSPPRLKALAARYPRPPPSEPAALRRRERSRCRRATRRCVEVRGARPSTLNCSRCRSPEVYRQ